MIDSATEKAFPNLYVLRQDRLQKTQIPCWFRFSEFKDGLGLLYQRVEIGFYVQRRLALPFIWSRLTSKLAERYALREPIRIRTIEDPPRFLDTLENRTDFRNYIAYEAISLFISCLDIKNIEIEDLFNLPAIIEKVFDDLDIFPSALHRDPLFSFCCFIELNLRGEKPPNSVIDALRISCIDCGIEVPDVLK